MRAVVRLTFTGVDEATDLEALGALWRAYPNVEFAALAGSGTDRPGTRARFPGRERLRALAALAQALGRRAALHLCGPYARAANAGRAGGIEAMACGFGRVQVNAREGEYDTVRLAALRRRLAGHPQIIVQTRAAPPRAPNEWGLAALFDRSGGRGAEGLDAWRAPATRDGRVGYAGGLGPHNIERALERVRGWGVATWLDMESGVRSADGFDIEKVRAVCAHTWGEGGER